MIKRKEVTVILRMKVPVEFYLPAFIGAVQGYLNGIKIINAGFIKKSGAYKNEKI